MNDDNDFNELFTTRNSGHLWFQKHREKLINLMKSDYHTLPVAAAYNAGYEEAMRKVRNETCHILQTKND